MVSPMEAVVLRSSMVVKSHVVEMRWLFSLRRPAYVAYSGLSLRVSPQSSSKWSVGRTFSDDGASPGATAVGRRITPSASTRRWPVARRSRRADPQCPAPVPRRPVRPGRGRHRDAHPSGAAVLTCRGSAMKAKVFLSTRMCRHPQTRWRSPEPHEAGNHDGDHRHAANVDHIESPEAEHDYERGRSL